MSKGRDEISPLFILLFNGIVPLICMEQQLPRFRLYIHNLIKKCAIIFLIQAQWHGQQAAGRCLCLAQAYSAGMRIVTGQTLMSGQWRAPCLCYTLYSCHWCLMNARSLLWACRGAVSHLWHKQKARQAWNEAWCGRCVRLKALHF